MHSNCHSKQAHSCPLPAIANKRFVMPLVPSLCKERRSYILLTKILRKDTKKYSACQGVAKDSYEFPLIGVTPNGQAYRRQRRPEVRRQQLGGDSIEMGSGRWGSGSTGPP